MAIVLPNRRVWNECNKSDPTAPVPLPTAKEFQIAAAAAFRGRINLCKRASQSNNPNESLGTAFKKMQNPTKQKHTFKRSPNVRRRLCGRRGWWAVGGGWFVWWFWGIGKSKTSNAAGFVRVQVWSWQCHAPSGRSQIDAYTDIMYEAGIFFLALRYFCLAHGNCVFCIFSMALHLDVGSWMCALCVCVCVCVSFCCDALQLLSPPVRPRPLYFLPQFSFILLCVWIKQVFISSSQRKCGPCCCSAKKQILELKDVRGWVAKKKKWK